MCTSRWRTCRGFQTEKNIGFRWKQTCFITVVTYNKLLNLLESQFSHLENMSSNNYLTKLLKRFNGTIAFKWIHVCHWRVCLGRHIVFSITMSILWLLCVLLINKQSPNFQSGKSLNLGFNQTNKSNWEENLKGKHDVPLTTMNE